VQCSAGAGSRSVEAAGDRVGKHPSNLARARQYRVGGQCKDPACAVGRLDDDHRHHSSSDPSRHRPPAMGPLRLCMLPLGLTSYRQEPWMDTKTGVAHMSGTSGQLRSCRGILAYTPAASSLYRCSPTTNWAPTAPLASHWPTRRGLTGWAATC